MQEQQELQEKQAILPDGNAGAEGDAPGRPADRIPEDVQEPREPAAVPDAPVTAGNEPCSEASPSPEQNVGEERRYTVQYTEDPPKGTGKLKVGLTVLSAVSLLLAAGFCVSLFSWNRSDRRAAELAGSNDRLTASIGAVQSDLSQTQSALDAEQSHSKDLESRVSAAEEQNSSLNRQLQDVQSELKRMEALKANRQPAAAPLTVSGEDKVIALTFDDGPGQPTPRLLDELEARGMKATFFVVGSRASQYADVLKRMVADGDEIGNHTYSHPNLTDLSEDDARENLIEASEAIDKACGVVPTLMRPPGGNYNDTVKSVAAGLGQCVVYWSVDTRDWQSKNVGSIMTTAFQSGRYGIRDGAIVLMHDIYPTTVDAAVQIMDKLQSEGYKTVTVSELLALRANGGTPGDVYTYVGP